MADRVAMVSGANRGIGEAIARKLAGNGWKVSLGIRGGAQPGWAAALPEGHVVTFDYDASEAGAEAAWHEATRERIGRVDCIVANAGVIFGKDVITISEEELQLMMQVNALAPRRLAQAAWEDLKASGRGRAIIMASLSGKRVKSAVSGSYSMTKYAAVALAHGLRHAGFDHGIRATAICPGLVATDMGLSVSDRAAGAMTRPEDVAALVATVIDLPNEASVAELAVNCQDEESY